ncbi:MAG: hypothetical protein IT385_20600 [Deltaproteobacteria bacterium]|nr:hypothetical protein [Deltaproteobacteria bacterium]
MLRELVLASMIVSLGSGARAADPRRPALPLELVGAATALVVRALPSELPPSRTELHFDCIDASVVGMEVVWDPASRGGLERQAYLPACKKWQVSLYAEPFPQPNDNGKIVNDAWRVTKTDGTSSSYTLDLERAADSAKREIKVTLTVGTLAQPASHTKLSESELAALAPSSTPTAPATASGGRSLGLVPQTGVELLDALGAVVIKKAGAAAQRLVRERLAELVCDRSIDMRFLGIPSIGSVADIAPKTCSALRQVDIFNLAASGRGLVAGIKSDLAGFLGRFLGERLKGSRFALVGRLVGIVTPILGGRAAEADDARRIVSLLAEATSAEWTSLLGTSAVPPILQGITAAAYCGATGECTPDRLRALAKSVAGSAGRVDDLIAFAEHVHRSFFGASGLPPREMLAAAVGIIERAFTLVAVTMPPEVERAVGLLDTAARGDLMAIVAAIADLVCSDPCMSDSQASVRRWARTLGAVAGAVALFVESDAQGAASKEEKAARREAQEAAIERMIEVLTDRSEASPGDLIWSIGGTLRAGLTRWFEDSELVTRPSLSFGFGLDVPVSSAFGVHADLGVLDIGNYLREPTEELESAPGGDDPRLWDLVDLSLTAGLYGSHDTPIYVAGTIGYAAYAEAWYGGFQVGVWIPFWDL